MKKRIIISCISFLILLASGIGLWQYHVGKMHNLLLSADTLIIEYPDSALHVLQNIKKPERMYGANKALYALLMTQAQYKNYIPVENDSLIRIAVDYYANEKDSLRKAWSYFYAAQVYRDTKDTKRSLSYFQKAATAAGGCNDYKLLDLLHYHWGRLLQNKKPYDEGLNKLLKAKEYGELNRDTVSLISTLGEIGWSYVWKEDYEQAETYLWRGIELAREMKRIEQLAWLNQCLSMSYQQNKEFVKALQYINESIRYSYEDSLHLKNHFSIKGLIFCELGQYDSAHYYIEKGNNEDNFYSIAYYQNAMSKIEKGLENYKKALEHHEIYSHYVDSINNIEKDNSLMELQKKYDYSIIQNENIHLKTENQKRNITILCITITAIIVIFIFYYIYNKVNRHKERVIRNKDSMLEQSLRQPQQKTNELLQNKQEIQERETELREYIRKEQGLKENIFQKEEELQSYIQQQKELKEQIFKMDETVKRIEEINNLDNLQKDKQSTKLRLSKQELDNLISAINICYNNFEKRLRTNYSSLSNEDIYVCCLLKMNVKTQDISYLLSFSDEALKKRKYRIKREKLCLTQENTSLEDYLKNF